MLEEMPADLEPCTRLQQYGLRDAPSVDHGAVRGTKVGYEDLFHYEAHAAVLPRNLRIVDDHVGGRLAPDHHGPGAQLDAQSGALRDDNQVMGARFPGGGTQGGSACPYENGGACLGVVASIVCGQARGSPAE
jgi:hypothetical protein